jgi:hypothetical protein
MIRKPDQTRVFKLQACRRELSLRYRFRDDE